MDKMLEAKLQQIKDYVQSEGITVRIERDSGLSLGNPGIYKDGLIKIFDRLPLELVPEAEAHELCHAILEYRGALGLGINNAFGGVSFSGKPSAAVVENFVKQMAELDFGGECDFDEEEEEKKDDYSDLSAKISNAIHHKVMMPLLYNDFGIVPHAYYALMQMWLDKTEIEIVNHDHGQIVNYTNGVFLYDISNVLPSESEKISNIAKLNPDAEKAYLASKAYLDRIDVSVSLTDQFKVVSEFLRVLDIEPERFVIYNFYHRE
ncbi:hypothetical protein GMST_40030 [Geomonas silvestris]|uniref:Uncharacterized protein n=1 Tax=Geomonas silvestris TaxID=2740184 RepID=A0A6V8MNQ8_9BACT|nr:hypothetical protein [Geomonas silvestris]GFO61678.1 hypothetical protein GMST_40030 [Geomonas silvestris]